MPIYRLGFVLQQSPEYQFHGRNLQHWVSGDPTIVPSWMPVASSARTAMSIRNRLGIARQAQSLVREACKHGGLDGLFFHPEATALYSASIIARLPSMITLANAGAR